MASSSSNDQKFEELTRRNKLLESLLEVVSEIVLILDLHGVVEFLNEQGHQLLGYGSGELIGKDWFETCLPVAERKEIKMLFQSLIEGVDETREGHTSKLQKRDGGLISVLWHNSLLRGDDGNVRGLLATGRDISRRVQLMEQLRKTETVITNTRSSVVITDTEGVIEFVNPAAALSSGYSRKELIGSHTRILNSGKQSQQFYKELWATLKAQKVWRGNFQNKRKDGSLYWESAIITPVIDEEGQTSNYLAIKDDISQTIQQQQQLELLSETLKSSKFAVIFSDAKNCVTAVNPAFTTITGYGESAVVGCQLKDKLCGPETDPETLNLIHQAVSAAARFEGDIQYYDVKGDRYWVHLQMEPLRLSQSGEISHYVEIQTLVTERMEAQQALLERGQELEAANQAKSVFLSVMSHELRTPLNPIIGMSEHMLLDCKDAEDRETLQIIRNSGAHLLELINDILDVGRIESGNVTVDLEELPLQPLLLLCIELVKDSAKGRDVELRTNLDQCSLVSVRADAKRLKQVILNLLSNALKFTEDGYVKVYCEQVEDSVCIHIEDTGIGMSPEQIPLIFNAFTQLDSSISRRFEGTGLGLSIVKQLIDLLGGEIKVKSELGVGSRFTVVLPVHRQLSGGEMPQLLATPVAEVLGDPQLCAVEGVEILVVEDNISNAYLLEQLLTRWGYSYHIAENGESALLKLREQSYQLVLLDLQLPDISGFEVCKQIRAMPKTADLCVIAQTAQAAVGTAEDCLSDGFDDYISKPLDLKKLKALLQAQLGH